MLTGLFFSRAFCQPSKVTAGIMAPMEGANWAVGPGFAPIGYVAHWYVIGHCVGIMAVHGVSQTRVLATSHPVPPNLALPPIPPTPSISDTDSRKGQQKIP